MRRGHGRQQEPLQIFCLPERLQSSSKEFTRPRHARVTTAWWATFPHDVSGISSALYPKITGFLSVNHLDLHQLEAWLNSSISCFFYPSVVHLVPLSLPSMLVPHTKRVTFSSPTSFKSFAGMPESLDRELIHHRRPAPMAQQAEALQNVLGNPEMDPTQWSWAGTQNSWSGVNMGPRSVKSQPLGVTRLWYWCVSAQWMCSGHSTGQESLWAVF